MSVLTAAAILGLVTTCGNVAPRSELASHLVATALQESGGDILIIHVNGPGGGAYRFPNASDATAYGQALDVAGIDWDGGLFGINRRQFARHRLTLTTVFDQCANAAAGADHLAADYRTAAIWVAAHSTYNTGSPTRGLAYAQRVADRIDNDLPAPSPLREPMRDLLHPSDQPADGKTARDLIQIPPPPDPKLDPKQERNNQ